MRSDQNYLSCAERRDNCGNDPIRSNLLEPRGQTVRFVFLMKTQQNVDTREEKKNQHIGK